jgi:hypothetical protein
MLLCPATSGEGSEASLSPENMAQAIVLAFRDASSAARNQHDTLSWWDCGSAKYRLGSTLLRHPLANATQRLRLHTDVTRNLILRRPLDQFRARFLQLLIALFG